MRSDTLVEIITQSLPLVGHADVGVSMDLLSRHGNPAFRELPPQVVTGQPEVGGYPVRALTDRQAWLLYLFEHVADHTNRHPGHDHPPLILDEPCTAQQWLDWERDWSDMLGIDPDAVLGSALVAGDDTRTLPTVNTPVGPPGIPTLIERLRAAQYSGDIWSAAYATLVTTVDAAILAYADSVEASITEHLSIVRGHGNAR
jgi:hypothetical protein